jgi:hypothetical protein
VELAPAEVAPPKSPSPRRRRSHRRRPSASGSACASSLARALIVARVPEELLGDRAPNEDAREGTKKLPPINPPNRCRSAHPAERTLERASWRISVRVASRANERGSSSADTGRLLVLQLRLSSSSIIRRCSGVLGKRFRALRSAPAALSAGGSGNARSLARQRSNAARRIRSSVGTDPGPGRSRR